MIAASADGDDDQEVADLEHRLLRVADRAGAGHQLRRAAEEGVGAGGDDDAFHLALLDDAARVGLVADLLGDRQRLAGQRRLVDRGVVAPHQAQVGRNDHAEADLDDVARHQRRGRHRLPSAVAQRRRLRRQALFQRRQRVRRLAVLPEFEPGIEEQQGGDDGEVLPVADQRRDDGRRLDHVGDRADEVSDQLGEHALLTLEQRVGAVLARAGSWLRLKTGRWPIRCWASAQCRAPLPTRRQMADSLRWRRRSPVADECHSSDPSSALRALRRPPVYPHPSARPQENRAAAAWRPPRRARRARHGAGSLANQSTHLLTPPIVARHDLLTAAAPHQGPNALAAPGAVFSRNFRHFFRIRGVIGSHNCTTRERETMRGSMGGRGEACCDRR